MKSERFSRSGLLYGDEAMNNLSKAKVCVIGAGAVGGYTIEALARTGVGRFYIADFDTVHVSNINRQILALDSTVGKKKCLLAKERILEINPHAKVEVLDSFIDAENLDEIFNLNADIFVDAIDSITSKVALLSQAVKLEKKIVSSMGAARKMNPLKIKTGDISETTNCPLAAKIRKALHQRAVRSGIPCVYSTESVSRDTHLQADEKTIGSCATITGIFGLMLADLAIKEIISM